MQAGSSSTAPPKIAFYGDDFTGATDTLATVSQAGLRSLLFLRPPDAALLARAGPLDVIGIAGASRSMGNAAMAAELEPVRRFFAGLGARIVHYKTCSTFDSAPHIGSIGIAIATLRSLSSNPLVAIVGGQPNLNRYCVFGNLFATVETGGDVHRIDRHETMSRHPVTPMTEADLRVHLARQGLARVASIDYTAYDLDEAALDARLEALVGNAADAVLFDVAHASHLAAVGRLLWQRSASKPLLAVGPSSVEQALMAHWQARAPAPPAARRPSLPQGPVLVVAGSLSGVTARQLARATSYVQVAVDPQRLLDGGVAGVAATVAAIVAHLSEGRHVLVQTSNADGMDHRQDRTRTAMHSSAGPAARDPGASGRLARATGELLRHLLAKVPLRRIGIAGGDTSSHAVTALDMWGLSYLGAVAPGVALCRAHAESARLDGIELMLKGGQMGQPDIFERLLGAV